MTKRKAYATIFLQLTRHYFEVWSSITIDLRKNHILELKLERLERLAHGKRININILIFIMLITNTNYTIIKLQTWFYLKLGGLNLFSFSFFNSNQTDSSCALIIWNCDFLHYKLIITSPCLFDIF